MSQILANAGSVTLTKTWYQDGTPTDVDDVTIGIVDGNGDTVVAAGTATTNAGSGVYTYNLADQSNPDQLTVTWTDDSSDDTRVDRIEVIGNWLFTEAQARSFRAKDDATDAVTPLASSTEYTDSTIAAERQRITDDLENWTERGWVPRYCRLELPGSSQFALDLSQGISRTSDGYPLNRPGRLNDIAVVLSIDVGGTSVSTSNVKIDGRKLIRTDSVWSAPTISNPHNVTVEYIYGLPYIVDGADRIALQLLVDRLVPSAFPDRLISADTEFGTVRYVQPGGPMRNVSRLPEVNQWVMAHDQRIWL